MSALSTKQLTVAVNELQEELKKLRVSPPASSIAAISQEYEAQLTAVKSEFEQRLSTQINTLQKKHDDEVVVLRSECDRKISELKLELETVSRVKSSTTVELVSGLFDGMNKRLTDIVSENKVRMSIVEDETIKSLVLVDENVKELERLAAVMHKPTDYREAAINEHMNESTTKNNNGNYLNTSGKIVSLASLEARIDKLEDYSRRDNLLFHGLEETSGENCENTVRDLLARKVLHGVCNVNNIVIVRAHRLGIFKSGQTRPVIVKFREYSDKQMILQQVYKGKLLNTGKWASEDFSVNTNNDRQYLRDHLTAAKNVLKGQIKSSSIRYKAIHIMNTNGKRFVFPLHKVERNSQTWWMGVSTGPDTDAPSDSIDKVGPVSDTTSDSQSSDQNSEGTQNAVELPEELDAEHIPVEGPAASSAATDEAEIP